MHVSVDDVQISKAYGSMVFLKIGTHDYNTHLTKSVSFYLGYLQLVIILLGRTWYFHSIYSILVKLNISYVYFVCNYLVLHS